jgi:hypothetical protein
MPSLFSQKPNTNVRFQLTGNSKAGKTYEITGLSNYKELGPMLFIDTTNRAKYERHRLSKDSEMIVIRNNVQFEQAIARVAGVQEETGECPYKTVVVDDWTTIYERIKMAFDESKLHGEIAESDIARAEEIKARNMAEWGKVKAIHSQMLRRLFDLDCNIILVAWETDKYVTKKDWKGKDVSVKEGETAKIEKNIKYFIDISLMLKLGKNGKRTYKVISDCSKTIKDGCKVEPSVFINAINILKEREEPVTLEDRIDSHDNDDDIDDGADESYDGPVCSKCKVPTSQKILDATNKKGKAALCWECYGSE